MEEPLPEPNEPQAALTVRIVGKTYSIREVEESPLLNRLYGQCNSGKGEILVQSGLCPDQHKDTVIHECLHAIDYAMSLDLEERQVHALAAGFVALINDNPDFIKTLFAL